MPLHAGARGLEDDCAVLEVASETLVITHDTMAEGTHFLPDADPADVAWKLVAVNLSDLAAKGAEPIGILLGYALGVDDVRFLEGLREVTETFNVPLLGGDTIRSEGPRTHGLTAIGRATHTPVPSRADAKVGDGIFVTGKLGDAMLGYEALRDGTDADSSAYRRPIPLLAMGQVLAPYASAMMDISDGLLLDSWRMAKASRVSFDLDSGAIPVADPHRLDECIRWGDDYQLLFTADSRAKLPAETIRIGQVSGSGDGALTLDGTALSPDSGLGYQH